MKQLIVYYPDYQELKFDIPKGGDVQIDSDGPGLVVDKKGGIVAAFSGALAWEIVKEDSE